MPSYIPDGIQKKFDWFPSVVGTSPRAKTGAFAREIKKIHYQIRVPAFTVNISTYHGFTDSSTLAAQYNYTVPFDFRVEYQIGQNEQLNNSLICVKYRVGAVVYRYFLGGNSQLAPAGRRYFIDPFIGNNMFKAVHYVNQNILQNFVIEIWATKRMFRSNPFVGVSSDMYINISRLVNPDTVDETSRLLPAGAFVSPTLFNALPESLPINNVDNAWLTN